MVGSNRLKFFLTCSREQLKCLLWACNQLWLSVFLHLIFYIFSSDNEDIIHSFFWSLCLLTVENLFLLCFFCHHVGSQIRTFVRICGWWHWLRFSFFLNFSGHNAPFLFLICVSMCFSPLILKIPEDIAHWYIPLSHLFSLGLSLQVTLGWAKRQSGWHNGI